MCDASKRTNTLLDVAYSQCINRFDIFLTIYSPLQESFVSRNINPGESLYSVRIVNSGVLSTATKEELTVDDNMGTYALMQNGEMRDFVGSHRRVQDT